MNWKWEDMSESQKQKATEAIKVPKKKHKFHAKPRKEGDKYFASQAEYHRWCELEQLQEWGGISNLIFQPTFKLTKANIKYRADFQYDLPGGETIVEDQKGFRTPRFNLIMRLWKYYGPYTIRITGKKGNTYGYVSEEIIPKNNNISS